MSFLFPHYSPLCYVIIIVLNLKKLMKLIVLFIRLFKREERNLAKKTGEVLDNFTRGGDHFRIRIFFHDLIRSPLLYFFPPCDSPGLGRPNGFVRASLVDWIWG